uniref:Uncharacterized protein n=1 Tax=Arion vulgaris TaxID=1028688 RepID=A0A0B7BVR5_9EUPU
MLLFVAPFAGPGNTQVKTHNSTEGVHIMRHIKFAEGGNSMRFQRVEEGSTSLL